MVRKFAHAQIAILDNFYSDDVIVIRAKIEIFPLYLLKFPSVKFLKIWHRCDTFWTALFAVFFKKICKPVFLLSQKKTQNNQKRKNDLDNPYFFCF